MRTRKYQATATGLVLISAIPFLGWPTEKAPQFKSTGPAAPPAVTLLLRRACYNCHSNETHWPWYSHVPLASRLIARDVERGRRAMNFSGWPEQVNQRPALAAASLLASCAAIQAGQMPKPPYTLLHPEARLTKADADLFCGWARPQVRQLLAVSRGKTRGQTERSPSHF